MSAFEAGDVCVWQNCVGGWAYLNGTETTLTGGMAFGYDRFTGERGNAYRTDTPNPFRSGECLLGAPHELRLKRPPTTDEAECRQAMLDCIERAKRGVGVEA